MNDDVRQAIALLRHQIISPVLVDKNTVQIEYFRKMEQQEFIVPGSGKRNFSVYTMKAWLKFYRKFGFTGLIPKTRTDLGQTRSIDSDLAKPIIELRNELLQLTVAKFYRRAKEANLLGDPPICELTLRRFLQHNKLFDSKDSASARKRYEMDRFGQLWVADFMHGPQVYDGKSHRKAILLAIIDDNSRMIVGAKWSCKESTLPLEKVFKEAVLKYGKPDKLYTDNGPSFSSSYLRSVCAHLGVGLVHSKPYDSPSRGKIERFFRTVRDSFLSDFKDKTLKEINDKFDVWLRDSYHHKKHNGINCRPIDRLQLSNMDYPRERVNEDLLEELFFVRTTRKVNKDATFSFFKLIYETPPKYIGSVIDLRYNQDRPNEVFLYEKDQKIIQLKAVDSRANGRTYKPKTRDSAITFQEFKK
jgi:transposase InsO family protein